MNLNGFINHKYRHREKNDLYTLIAISNQTVPVQSNAQGEPEQNPKFRVDAFYRKEETGEIFSRPYIEFESKFAICFEDLEASLIEDYQAVCKVDDRISPLEARTWKINVMGVGRSLYTIFPLIEENVRNNILRALQLSSFITQGIDPQIAVDILGERYGVLAKQLVDVNRQMDGAKPGRAVDIPESLLGDDTVALLMLGSAANHRELSFEFLRPTGYQSEEHRLEIIRQLDVRREDFYKGLAWFSGMKITVAMPPLPAMPNLFSEEEAQEVLGSKA